MKFRIKQISEMTGVSIRTLHHYDHIGLLRPARMNEAGYRLYSEDDLIRLQEILFFRELDFSLAEIKSTLESPGYSRIEALAAQKQLLALKIEQLKKMTQTIDRTILAENGGSEMYADELFEGLDADTLEEYKKEARERWGNTEAYKESERRTAKYSKADWERINAESGDIHHGLAEVMETGKAPSDSGAQEQIARWFNHICKYFYACTPEMFKGLGEMYVADPRFKKVYEDIKPGLAEFAKQAMAIYADSL